MSIPKKGDVVINPKTNRPIRVGGATWLKAVKEGVIMGAYQDDRKLKLMPEEATPEDWETERALLDEKLPPNKQAVKGRGKYKNSLVVRDKGISPRDASIYTAKMATQAVKNNIKELSNAKDEEEISRMLEKMIMSEMMTGEEVLPGVLPPQKVERRQTTFYEEDCDEEFFASDSEYATDDYENFDYED